MTKQDKQQARILLDRLSDFFWVYYDAKTAKTIKNHPDRAIPMIREAVINDRMSRNRITTYVSAMRDAVDYHRLVT